MMMISARSGMALVVSLPIPGGRSLRPVKNRGEVEGVDQK